MGYVLQIVLWIAPSWQGQVDTYTCFDENVYIYIYIYYTVIYIYTYVIQHNYCEYIHFTLIWLILFSLYDIMTLHLISHRYWLWFSDLLETTIRSSEGVRKRSSTMAEWRERWSTYPLRCQKPGKVCQKAEKLRNSGLDLRFFSSLSVLVGRLIQVDVRCLGIQRRDRN